MSDAFSFGDAEFGADVSVDFGGGGFSFGDAEFFAGSTFAGPPAGFDSASALDLAEAGGKALGGLSMALALVGKAFPPLAIAGAVLQAPAAIGRVIDFFKSPVVVRPDVPEGVLFASEAPQVSLSFEEPAADIMEVQPMANGVTGFLTGIGEALGQVGGIVGQVRGLLGREESIAPTPFTFQQGFLGPIGRGAGEIIRRIPPLLPIPIPGFGGGGGSMAHHGTRRHLLTHTLQELGLTRRKVSGFVRMVGVEATAGMLGLSVLDVATAAIEGRRRRARGISARDLRTTNRVARRLSTATHNLEEAVGRRPTRKRRHHHHK